MWKEGSIDFENKNYRYRIKQYDEGSVFGINFGRISKLMIKLDGKIVCNYDRGWDVEPADKAVQSVLDMILKAENQ